MGTNFIYSGLREMEDDAARRRKRLTVGSSEVALRMGFESPVLLTIAAGQGQTGEVAKVMRPMGSSHRIASPAQQLDLCDASPYVGINLYSGNVCTDGCIGSHQALA
jgi:hypothetical protein